MTPFHRKPASPEIENARATFRRVTSELDAAQRTLLAAVPTSRDVGTPLAEALDGFAAGLERAGAVMPGWRIERTEALWARCAAAIAASRAAAQRLRGDPSADRLGFEQLNARLGDIVSPLEEFADVAADLKRLR